MIIASQGLSKREKILILALVIIVVFAGYTWYEIRNSSKKYERNEVYCEADYDCVVLYDFISDNCLTVNGLHKYKYEFDVTCREKTALCRDNQCILE